MNTLFMPSKNALVGAAFATTGLLFILSAWTQSRFGSSLLPHAFCITSSPSLLTLHALSDGLIALAYILIPWSILRFVMLRGDVPFGWLAWMFGAFIVACGSTHLLDVVTLWTPIYWYSGVAKAFTAVVSLGTAWTIYRLTPQALALPSLAKVRTLNDELTSEIETRKRAEEQLRRAQDELQRLLAERTAQAADLEAVLDRFFANAPLGMAVFDEEARVVRANPAMAHITRRRSSDFEVGREVREMEGISAEASDAIESVVRGGPPVTDLVYHRHTPEGVVTIKASYFPIALESGRAITGALVQDITHQRKLEREREDALEAAQAASKAKDEFLANVSHELRSPLQVVLASAEVIRRVPEMHEKVHVTVERLVSAVRQQARMIGDLVDLSRVLNSKLHLEPVPLDPRQPVIAAIEAVSETLQRRSMEVRLDESPQECRTTGDASRLQQVYVNILENAIRFSPEGGVITVHCRADGSSYCVSVADQGCGIPPDRLESIFEAFSQASEDRQQRAKGLGLGLAIARGIVLGHGGRIWAESGPQGSTFHVCLPLMADYVPVAQPREQVMPKLDGLRLLYVEDQVDIAEGMLEGLQSLGANVRLAHSYESAVRAFEAEEFDAVVCDINLGEERSGLDVARYLRSSARGANLHLVALSAYRAEHGRDASQQAGFDAFIVKPAELAQVARELKTARR